MFLCAETVLGIVLIDIEILCAIEATLIITVIDSFSCKNRLISIVNYQLNQNLLISEHFLRKRKLV
jgi:hypothetical protein